MVRFMTKYPENEKMIEWNSKSRKEQEEVAMENGWSWFFDWTDVGSQLLHDYEQVDKDPNVHEKYGGYDNLNKETEVKHSYVYMGMDFGFHISDTPTDSWIEYQPCTNADCKYYDPKSWGVNGGGNCGLFGDVCRLNECHAELFVLIQQYVDVCGIEAINDLQKEWCIHEDIVDWFKSRR